MTALLTALLWIVGLVLGLLVFGVARQSVILWELRRQLKDRRTTAKPTACLLLVKGGKPWR